MSTRRPLVLRHGPSPRLQEVAIFAGYEPPVQRSAYGRRDPGFEFCRRYPRFRLTPLCASLAIACITNLRTTCTRTATALHLRTRTLSDMVALDKRLYTSHHVPTDNPDHVKLARTGCMSPSSVRLSFSRYCTRQPHPCTVLTAAHHPHTRPPDVPACLAYPKSLIATHLTRVCLHHTTFCMRALRMPRNVCLDPRSHRNASLHPGCLPARSGGGRSVEQCALSAIRYGTRYAKWAGGSRSQTHRRADKGGFTQDDV